MFTRARRGDARKVKETMLTLSVFFDDRRCVQTHSEKTKGVGGSIDKTDLMRKKQKKGVATGV
tara:strand:- start:997 stop:1185 length:189 start_codon:yes stop_codon:yes gene_type:complete